MEDFSALKELQQFKNLEYLAKQVVEGFVTGLHKSPFHGFSVEFAEHKSYNPGDSIKNIDWKLYGKTEKLYTKRYEEETNLRCNIVLDISSSMYYPAAKENKIDTAPIKLVAPKPTIEKKITKLYEKENKDGLDQIYVDATSAKTDTISIFIPYSKTNVAIDTIKQAKAEPVVEHTMESKNIDAAAPVILANNCLNKASESDVANFSSQIQATLTLKNKLKLANTVLKEKCFTVNQVKRLGVLFLNESGKFNFYKLAQTAVSDSKNFALLEKELLDVKLKEEFKALSNPQ
jgi:hypothetical protein